MPQLSLLPPGLLPGLAAADAIAGARAAAAAQGSAWHAPPPLGSDVSGGSCRLRPEPSAGHVSGKLLTPRAAGAGRRSARAAPRSAALG